MEVVFLEADGGQFGVGHLDTRFVTAGVEFGLNAQAGMGAGVRNQVDDDLVTDEGLPPANSE